MGTVSIFLSHSSQDKEFCDALVYALRAAGADVWYDNDDLGPGSIRDIIARQIEVRTVFIVVLSKAALASTFVKQECSAALFLQEHEPERTLLPVTTGVLEPTDFRGAWLFIASMKRIEAPGFRPYAPSETIERVLHALALVPHHSYIDTTNDGALLTPPAPPTADELLMMGKALYAQRRYAEAVVYLDRAARFIPSRRDVWFSLAKALSFLHRDLEALEACERLLSVRRNDASALVLEGEVLYALNRYEDAVRACEHALAIQPYFKEARALRARAKRALGWQVVREDLDPDQ